MVSGEFVYGSRYTATPHPARHTPGRLPRKGKALASAFVSKLLVLQAGNTGQLQAFQEFQGSAAAGGDVGDAVSKA